MDSDLKLHDKLTGLKLCATRELGPGRSKLHYSFSAPRTIPPELIPENRTDTRANVAAFARINKFLKDRIVLLD